MHINGVEIRGNSILGPLVAALQPLANFWRGGASICGLRQEFATIVLFALIKESRKKKELKAPGIFRFTSYSHHRGSYPPPHNYVVAILCCEAKKKKIVGYLKGKPDPL